MVKIGTIINFCSLDDRFIGPCIRAVAPLSVQVVVPWADHLFDNTPEDVERVRRAAKENSAAQFVPFEYHHSITEMLRPRFWHNYARWVGLSRLAEDCDWVLFLDADEIVETDRFRAFLETGAFESCDHLYFANYWYFREPRFRARQVEDSPALIRRSVITVNRIFHEHERATFRRLPNGRRRVPGLDGRPMFHHYSWVMDKARMLQKVRTWGHSLDTDRDWTQLVEEEFSRPFSGRDFVHGYHFDVVEPLIETEKDASPSEAKITVTTPDTPSPGDSKPSVAGLRIGFHSNQLGLRGSDVALYDYARFGRDLLGLDPVIIADGRGDLQGLDKFRREFPVELYDDFSRVQGVVDRRGLDAVYFLKAGGDDGKTVRGARTLVHAAFQVCQPHGDVYAYVSRWLAERMDGGRHPWVPHMVHLPDTDRNFRDRLGIPETARVFGRYGGRDGFDLPFVHEVVRRVAAAAPRIYFLFMNTEPFCEPMGNILHLNPTWDLEAKTAFINTCDAMLHGRRQGESFGLAIAEFLLRDKPVIAWADGVDRNHRVMLGEGGLTYKGPADLFDRLTGFVRSEPAGAYRERVAEFAPEKVMETFRNVFFDQWC